MWKASGRYTVQILTTYVAAISLFTFSTTAHALVQSGSYVGDGLDDRAITGIGFRPDVVIVKGNNLEDAALRTSTMSGDNSKEMVGTQAFVSNWIQSLDANGFSIGTDNHVNETGITFHWIAFQAAPEELVLGTYAGDDNDDRSITGVGFQPDYLIVLADWDDRAVQRFSGQPVTESLVFEDTGPQTTKIQDFEVDGFKDLCLVRILHMLGREVWYG